MRSPLKRWLPTAFSVFALGCAGPEAAPEGELPIFADASEVSAVDTDLGYRVSLDDARVMVRDLQFAIAGEAHTASLWRAISSALVATAHAHPGHYQGGEVTGELRGGFLLQWVPEHDDELGIATLLAGDYHSLNFTFDRATEDDGVSQDDALLGHTALFTGTAEKDGTTLVFVAQLDSPENRQLVGVPFDATIEEGSDGRIGVGLLPLDPHEDDTLFDGIDFAALDSDGDGQVSIAAGSDDEVAVDAYNRLLRTFQTHDHFQATLHAGHD